MTTTSGSPTQNGSVDVRGLPDDAFAEGDMGQAPHLWPNSTFRLKRGAPPSPPDGVNSISSLSGSGYWEVFRQQDLSNVPVVARVEDLRDTQSATTSGSIVYVESVRSYFQKVVEPDSGNDDGITIARDASTGSTWYRLPPRSLSWEMQANWYVDALAGDDQNPGTQLSPIRTFAEFSRRAQKLRVRTVVNIVQDTTEVLEGTFCAAKADVRLDVKGSYQTLASGATTAFVAPSFSTNAMGTLTCAEVPDFSIYIGKMVRLVRDYGAGNLVPMTVAIVKGVAGTATYGGWFGEGFNSWSAPTANTPIEVIELVDVASARFTGYGLYLRVWYLRQTSAADTWVVQASGLSGPGINGCEFNGDVDLVAGRIFAGCLFKGSGDLLTVRRPTTSVTGSAGFNGGTFMERDCVFPAESYVAVQALTVYRAKMVIGDASPSPTAMIYSYGAGVFESPAEGFLVYGNAVCGYREMYGKDNVGVGMIIHHGAKLLLYPTYTPIVTGSSDFLYLGGGDQIPPLVAGANVPALAPFATWANFNAAPFARKIMSYEDGTVIYAA